ncbi:MAG: L-methionine (R)-S-oxide reductase [Thermotogaceae bacterium]|nr:L-methionine (R)-S-oxide reductase [Thermotogaceae bacterium]
MRSILREKSQDFFRILQHDRSEWKDFWKEYCEENREFMSGYNKKLALDDNTLDKILKNTGRPFLDRIKQKNDEIKHLKQKAAKIINEFSLELELTQEDFVIYLIGALGIKDVVTFESDEGLIVLIDIVSLCKNNRIEQLQDIVLVSAKDARRILNQKQEVS